MTKSLMFFIDFDGTISRDDICLLMLENFGGDNWREFNRQWENGDLTTEECANLVLSRLQVNPAELEDWFDQARIDETFLDFVRWAMKHEYPLYILSDGYDIYIGRLLRRYGLNIPFFANHLTYRQGWEIACLNYDGICRRHGVCKTRLMESLLHPDHCSVYIGDGYSDICPAEKADLVFAKDDLARLCGDRGIAYHPYACFDDIMAVLTKITDEKSRG